MPAFARITAATRSREHQPRNVMPAKAGIQQFRCTQSRRAADRSDACAQQLSASEFASPLPSLAHGNRLGTLQFYGPIASGRPEVEAEPCKHDSQNGRHQGDPAIGHHC